MNLNCPKCTARIAVDLTQSAVRADLKHLLCISCGNYFDATDMVSEETLSSAVTLAEIQSASSSATLPEKRMASIVELTPAMAAEEFRRLSERPKNGSTLPTSAPTAAQPAPPIAYDPAKAKRDTPVAPPTSKTETPLPFPEIKRGRNVPKRIGNYDIIDEINRGGMGIVYKATDPNLRRIVAIKVLIGGDGSKDEDIMRFRREAQATARLHHPNIVHIHSVGEHDGMPYFVMDFVKGRTAKELKDGGKMSPRLALTIIEGSAEGLHHAHEHGVVHRDVKPANIIVDETEHAQLMDFGLARRVDEDLEITQSGTTMGTPSYMSPEQAEGKLGEVDAQSDVYSLGACLYELLTGQPPFEANTVMATLRKVLDEAPVSPRKLNPRIHRDVETICMKCLEKEKKSRYASAKQLAEDIRRFNRGEAILAKPLSRMALVGRAAWRHKEVTLALLAIVVFGISALGYTVNESRRVALQQVQDQQQRLTDALEEGRQQLGLARTAVERLGTFGANDFQTKLAEARTKIADATKAYQKVESLAPENHDSRVAFETLKKMENTIEVQRFIQKARFFLNPPPGRADEPAQLPNFTGAEFAAQEAVDRDPTSKEARDLLRAAIGIRPVRIEVSEGEADVFAKRIADGLGRPLATDPADLGKSLGKAPVSGVELEPGLYVINVKHSNGSQQQATMQVSRESRDEDLQLSLRVNSVEENMVVIYAGSVTIPQAGQKQIGAFAIDRFEWPNRAGMQPLTDVTEVEARTFCKQKDKQLCNTDQWLRACMGDDERRYPYAKIYSSRVCATGYDADAQKHPFVSGAFPRCHTPEGVYDMSGNVAEWTDTPQEESVFGGDWTSSTKFAELTVSCWARTLPEQVNKSRLGFRCCKQK